MNNQTNDNRDTLFAGFTPSKTETEAREYAKKKSGGLLFALAFLISFIFLRLTLHGGGLGYSMPILSALSWVLFLPFIISRDKKFSWTGIISLLPIFSLSLCCAVFSGDTMVKFITLLTMLTLTLLQNVKTSGISTGKFFSWDSFKLAMRTVFFTPFEVMGAAFSSLKSKNKGKKGAFGKALLGVLISIPAVVFLICYFSITDAVFGYYVKHFIDILNLNVFTVLFDLIGAGIISLYLFPYNFALCVGTNLTVEEKEKKKKGLDGVYVASFLGSCTLVYLAFVAVQFGYLFNAKLPADLTSTISYSEYARKGFFELCFIIFATFLVILIAMKITKKTEKGRLPVYVKAVLTVLALSDIIFVVSAMMRVYLYVDAYGMTRARVIGAWFAVLLGICTVGVIIKVIFDRLKITYIFASAVVLMVVGLNMMNIDAFIAKYNVDRYYKTGKIDTNYIEKLSLSAGMEALEITNEYGREKDEKLITVEKAERCSKEIYKILAEKCWEFQRDRKFGSWTWTEVDNYNKLMKIPEIKELVDENAKNEYFYV